MKIFWRIFLSFWFATALILAIVFSSSEPLLLHRLQHPGYQPATSTLVLDESISAYEKGGPSAFLTAIRRLPELDRDVLLFDSEGRVLVSPPGRERVWSSLALECAHAGVPVLQRRNARAAFAAPATGASGSRYVVVFATVKPIRSRFYRMQFWAKLAVAMVPVSVLCFLLSLYITRPVRALQLMTRSMAAGDLSSRAPAAQLLRRDELGDLTRDVDAMAQRIESLLSAQKRFVTNVSHELSAPITRLQLALSLLEQGAPELESPGLSQVERETDRLSELVQELLFLASLESATIPMESFVKLSLDALCGEILQDNTAEMEACSCTVLTTLQRVEVIAAPQALRRAIENVFRNAVRYCPSASTIQFECGRDVQSGFAQVVVADSGPGVPPSMLHSIFEPFVRAVPAQAGKQGTGLGLAIAAEAVHLHGGTIQAENRPQGGLRVTLRIPVNRGSTQPVTPHSTDS